MGGYQTRDYSGTLPRYLSLRALPGAVCELYGLNLPSGDDPADPVFRAYRQFKQQTVSEHHDRVYRFIVDRWPQIAIANHTQFRRGFIRQESNTAIERPLPHWQYDASDNTRWAVGSYPGDGVQ